jgi:cell division protein FtsB
MNIAHRTAPAFATVALACIVGYFLYHTVEGERGWVAQMHLRNEVDVAGATLARLREERQELEHRVHLMRPESLDPDLLDEESRKTLNYSKPNEIIILAPQDKKAAPIQ